MDSEVYRIYEKMGALEQIAASAHKRIDSFVPEMRASTNEIKLMIEKLIDKKEKELEAIEVEVAALTESMNRGKGWAAAGLFLAGTLGAGITELIGRLFNK